MSYIFVIFYVTMAVAGYVTMLLFGVLLGITSQSHGVTAITESHETGNREIHAHKQLFG